MLGTLVFAYWMHWIAWVAMMAFRADMSDFEAIYLLYPPALLDIIGTIYEEGTWSMRGSVVNGIPLGIAWVLEALIFFGAGNRRGTRHRRNRHLLRALQDMVQDDLPLSGASPLR